MRLLVLHGVADGFVVWWMENYRKRFIRYNRVEKISSEPDAVIKIATSDSRAIGSRPLVYSNKRVNTTRTHVSKMVAFQSKAFTQFINF